MFNISYYIQEKLKINKDSKPKTNNNTGKWEKIENPDYDIDILAFKEPSVFGIDKGCISKLCVTNKHTHTVVCNYDRGWDVKPTHDFIKLYHEIIDKYNY